MSENWKNHILLENPKYFDFGNGLWTGKKPPFKTVTVIRNTNFTDSGKIDYSNVAVLEVERKQFEQRKLIKGDIVIERSGGGPKQPVGRVVYFDKDKGDFSFSNFTSRVRVINEELNTEFVFYFLMYFYEAGNTFEMQAQTTGIRNLDFTKYKNSVRIPLIPLNEQNKIVYVLSAVQKAIEQQDKLIQHTTELKKALMQKLFTEGTKSEKLKQTEIGLVPVSWEVTTIGEMYDFTSKPRGLNIELPVPFIPMDIVPRNEIYIKKYELRDSLSSGTYVENGDLLLAKITPSFENGKQGIVSIDKPYSYATTEVIPIKGKADISDKFYLFYYLLKDDVRKPLTDKMEGSTGRQRLSKTILEETLIPKPPIAEQKDISQTFLSFNEKLSFLNRKKQTLADLFKTLLHELMTGQRRVNEIHFLAAAEEYIISEQALSMAAEQ
jgi:type I restriction enzyme S subunit